MSTQTKASGLFALYPHNSERCTGADVLEGPPYIHMIVYTYTYIYNIHLSTRRSVRRDVRWSMPKSFWSIDRKNGWRLKNASSDPFASLALSPSLSSRCVRFCGTHTKVSHTHTVSDWPVRGGRRRIRIAAQATKNAPLLLCPQWPLLKLAYIHIIYIVMIKYRCPDLDHDVSEPQRLP